LSLSIKTVETHRESIKRKLGLKQNVELLQQTSQWVLEQG
jgi:DNA-binding CsgD family transcriptional regulator